MTLRDWTDPRDGRHWNSRSMSFEVMTGRGIREVLTLDHHFSEAGFVMVPAP